jgi:predicted dehydrogenase
VTTRPRLGFLGVGWIGRDRMRAVASAGLADVAVVADADPTAAAEAAAELGAEVVAVEQLLRDSAVDGVVIATPSALHAEQALVALDRGVAVFCQKPLARTAAEASAVVTAARWCGRPFAVDLSYRHIAAAVAMREIVASGAIGHVHAADLVFHNGYGPDKPWFLDRARSGGGCVIDLATHLIDMAQWMLPDERFEVALARRFARGKPLPTGSVEVEDFATAVLDMCSGGAVSVSCSWFLHAGTDAAIQATFYGTDGAVSLTNVEGSFYDFEAAVLCATRRKVIASPPDAWTGRAVNAWAAALSRGQAVDLAELDRLVATSELIDAIYER